MPRWTLRLLPFLATPPRVEVLQARKLYQSDIQTLGTLAFQTAYHSSGGVIALLTLFFLYKGFRSTYSPALLLIAMAVSRMLAMTIAFWWPIISTVPPPPPEATAVLSEGSSVSGETAADKSNTVCRNQEGMSSQATATSTTRESDSRTATETTASSPESGAVESAATSASCGNVDMETTTRVLTRVVNRPANTQNLKITEATARPMPLPGPLKPRSAGEIEGSERVEHAMTRISFRDNLWSVVLQTALFCFCIIPMLVHYIAALDHLLPAFNRLSVDGFAEIITAALVALATVLTIPAALSGLALVDQRSLKSWLPRLAVAWIGLAAAVLVGSQPWTVMTPKRVDIVHYSKSTHRSSYNLNRIPSNATADVAGDARLEAEERRSEVERISSAGILMQTVDDEGMREEILRHYQHRVRKLLLHVTGYRGRPRGPDGDDIWSFKKLQCDALDRKDCTLSVPHGILPRTIATKTMLVMEFDGFPPPLADKATVDGVWTLPLSNRPMSWGKNVADEQARDPPATWIGAFLNEQFVTQLCGIDWQDLPAGRRCAVMAVKRFSFGRGPSMFTGAGASTSADFFDANRLAEPFSSAFPELVVSWNVAPVEGSDGRRVKVKIDVRAGCRQVLLFPQTGVVGWSLSSELPPPREDCDCHAILYNSSSAGPSDLHMWIDVDLETLPRSGREGEEKQPELSFSVVSLRFQLITPFVAIGLDTLAYNQMRNEFEANAQPFQPPQDKANQASPPLSSFSNGDAFDAIRFKDLSLPDWVSPVSSASELQEYKIVFSGLRDQRRR